MTLEQMAIVRNALGMFYPTIELGRNYFTAPKGDERLLEMEKAGIMERVAERGKNRVYRVRATWLEAMGVEVSR